MAADDMPRKVRQQRFRRDLRPKSECKVRHFHRTCQILRQQFSRKNVLKHINHAQYAESPRFKQMLKICRITLFPVQESLKHWERQ